jgi:hypothetical protein
MFSTKIKKLNWNLFLEQARNDEKPNVSFVPNYRKNNTGKVWVNVGIFRKQVYVF